MDLTSIVEIYETTKLGESNRYLKAGWVLINSSAMTTDSQEYSSPIIKYSLGWPNARGQAVHPDPVY